MENSKQWQAGKAEENQIEPERGLERTPKEIVDEIFRVFDHIYLIDINYQDNVMMSIRKEYEMHSSFLGQSISQSLYDEAVEVSRRFKAWNDQIDSKVFDVDDLLKKTGEEEWNAARVVAEIIHQNLMTKDELTSLLKRRKEIELTPEYQQTFNEWKTFAKRIHNDYLNFLESRLATVKIKDLELLERDILANLESAEEKKKNQHYVDRNTKMLEFTKKYINHLVNDAGEVFSNP